MEIPVLSTGSVFHIGTLDAAHKGECGNSLEGHCLSVSVCPNAWVQIAKLGGRPLHRLENPDGVFLDVLRTEKDEALRATIQAWGIEEGYAAIAIKWRAWQYDSETDQWGYFLLGNKEDAMAEADMQCEYKTAEDIPGPEGHAGVEAVEVLVGTSLLAERVGVSDIERREAFDFVALVWVEDTQPQLDGLWWSEDYEPESLSAPRGGILPSRLDRWNALQDDLCCVEDDPSEEMLTPAHLQVIQDHLQRTPTPRM